MVYFRAVSCFKIWLSTQESQCSSFTGCSQIPFIFFWDSEKDSISSCLQLKWGCVNASWPMEYGQEWSIISSGVGSEILSQGFSEIWFVSQSGPPPAFVNKVLLEHATLICLHIDSGCFHPATAEMSSPDRDCTVCKSQNIHQNLPTPAVVFLWGVL